MHSRACTCQWCASDDHKRRCNVRALIVFTALAVMGVSVYVGVAAAGGHSGFPLDDAWIHQTYARNWAETGQLAYVAGQPSAGSTAPLWTLLISIAYRLRIDPFLWTRLLGAVSLGVSAWLLYRLADRLMPGRRTIAWAIGLLGVGEWHLIWAAASGMETILFIALALALIDRVWTQSSGWAIGVIGGLLIVTRPEGVLLIGLAVIVLLARSAKGGPKEIVKMLLGSIIVAAPGLWLNVQASGSLFPNTFYAKQREYAELMSSPSVWVQSVFEMSLAPLAGVSFVLLPGLITWLITQRHAMRQRNQWALWLPLAWLALHMAVYALRLPVHYQHGRYLIPIIPIVILYGAIGTTRLIDRRSSRGMNRLLRVSGLTLAAAAVIVLIMFVPLGATAYATDTAVIDDEMVVVAQWLNDHVPPDAIIAAHDIGSIGYFTRRPLLDLAGLISPEVIPFIRDEAQLMDWMSARQAAYFVTFPGWYPTLSRSPVFVPIFEGHSSFSPEHLTVYRKP